MENNTDPNPVSKWLSVPIIATITRLLCRELTIQNEYLRRDNKILSSRINKRIGFTGDKWKLCKSASRGGTIANLVSGGGIPRDQSCE